MFVVDDQEAVCIFPGPIRERSSSERFYDKLEDLKSLRSKKFSEKFENCLKSFTCDVCPLCKEKYMQYPGLKRAHRKKAQCWKYSFRNKRILEKFHKCSRISLSLKSS